MGKFLNAQSHDRVIQEAGVCLRTVFSSSEILASLTALAHADQLLGNVWIVLSFLITGVTEANLMWNPRLACWTSSSNRKDHHLGHGTPLWMACHMLQHSAICLQLCTHPTKVPERGQEQVTKNKMRKTIYAKINVRFPMHNCCCWEPLPLQTC